MKVKRLEKILKDKEEGKIQPTLKSFMDRRGGLMGPKEQPGPKTASDGLGNQMSGGQGLHQGSSQGSSLLLGETRRGKESCLGDGIKSGKKANTR